VLVDLADPGIEHRRLAVDPGRLEAQRAQLTVEAQGHRTGRPQRVAPIAG